MKPGWIRIWRKIKTNSLWEADKPFPRVLAWIDILIRAAYEEEDVWFMGNTIRLARGELVTSLRILSKEWGWSKNKVDRFLNQLVELKMIEKRDTSLLRIFVVNYGKYQPLEEAAGTRKGQQRDTSNNSEERKKLMKELQNIEKPTKVKHKEISFWSDRGLSEKDMKNLDVQIRRMENIREAERKQYEKVEKNRK